MFVFACSLERKTLYIDILDIHYKAADLLEDAMQESPVASGYAAQARIVRDAKAPTVIVRKYVCEGYIIELYIPTY